MLFMGKLTTVLLVYLRGFIVNNRKTIPLTKQLVTTDKRPLYRNHPEPPRTVLFIGY